METYKGFPALTQDQLDECNDLFPAYVFFRRNKKTGTHLWTSCCHIKDYVVEDQRTIDITVLDFAHYAQHNVPCACPFCGRDVTAKELGRTGQRKNLRAYRNVMFLHAEEGSALYAQAYVARKDYGRETHDLHAYPTYFFAAAYEFCPGAPKRIWKSYYSGKYAEETGRAEEPFLKNYLWSYTREDYDIISLDAIGRSCMKYSQYEQWANARRWTPGADHHWELARYLSTYCLYPQIEMLMKMGLRDVVCDLVINQKKNAAAIDWSQSDPRKAFGLTKPELQFFLSQQNPDIDDVAVYKRLRRHGQRVDFGWLCGLSMAGYDKIKLLRLCLDRKLGFRRTVNYLNRFVGPLCYGGYFNLTRAWQLWKDYISMGYALGYDMADEVVTYPRELKIAHDTASTLLTQLKAEQEARRNAEEAKLLDLKMEERTAYCDKRYSFRRAGWHIRPPASTLEIIAEGQTLRHCVARYAKSHARGTTTILFLRSDEAPDTPLVTIEMQGDRLIQIHGYQNDYGAEDPKKTYAAIVVPWLKWVKAGSRRDKQGRPILPKTDDTAITQAPQKEAV